MQRTTACFVASLLTASIQALQIEGQSSASLTLKVGQTFDECVAACEADGNDREACEATCSSDSEPSTLSDVALAQVQSDESSEESFSDVALA